MTSNVTPQPGSRQASWQDILGNSRSLQDLVEGVSRYNKLELKALPNLAILGAAPEGRRLAQLCKAQNINITMMVDDDPAKVGTSINGVTVQSSDALAKLDRKVPVVIASHRVLSGTQKLRGMGFQSVLPFAALQIVSPERFQPHMFYDGWLQDLVDNRAQYDWLHDNLADARSREVLDAVIRFRLTADPLVLAPILDEGRFHQGLYHPAGVFECDDHEVYVDAGAFDGDSMRWFQDRVRDKYDRIVAFEPDPDTFARLKKNFEGQSRVDLVNAGLHRNKAVLRFRNDASRGAIFTEDGESKIEVVSLDDVLAGDRASFIKMNIEGAEIDALHGARKTIEKWLPKLALSVYHRPSDLWQIPKLVRSFSDEYDLYLRQHDGGVIETVLYAIPKASVARPA